MIVDLILPDDITCIRDYAFSHCNSIKKVVLNSNIISIGNGAFFGCKELESISVLWDENAINSDESGFIGEDAFHSCSKLKSVDIPNTIQSIYSCAFVDCTSLTDILIPDSVITIGDSAFLRCSNITSVQLSDNITLIGESAFSGCSGFSTLTIPDSVITIGNYAFSNCQNLSNVTIGNSVKSIGVWAFGYCSNIKNLIIPDSVTYIGAYCLSNCTSLESITIPFIGERKNGTENTNFGYIFGSNASYQYKYVPQSLKNVIVTNDVIVDDYAFYGCDNIESIVLPESICKIGDYAFAYCSSISAITIPANVMTIGRCAFFDCGSLNTAVFNNSIGWWYASSADATSGTAISSKNLSDPSTAARYLKTSFYDKWWSCN